MDFDPLLRHTGTIGPHVDVALEGLSLHSDDAPLPLESRHSGERSAGGEGSAGGERPGGGEGERAEGEGEEGRQQGQGEGQQGQQGLGQQQGQQGLGQQQGQQQQGQQQQQLRQEGSSSQAPVSPARPARAARAAPQACPPLLPDVRPEYAHRTLLQYLLLHTRYMHYGEPMAYPSPLPEGTQAGELVYGRLQAGTGHPLAGLWRGTFGLHGVEILNFVPSRERAEAAAALGPSGCGGGGGGSGEGGAGSRGGRGCAGGRGGGAGGGGGSGGGNGGGGGRGGAAVDARDGAFLLGFKVTGDANVPAGQVSIEIDASSPHTDPTCAPGTPLRLPPGVDSCVGVDALAQSLTVVAAYRGRGHIAETGFMRDRWIPVEVVMCEPHSLGVIWHGLDSFSFFSRLEL
ncbi:hypothetical protein FOA52_000993 [Chlamydomonas sp. UWO 241]|nr:hypothetical protein FOA52_000993 [Chlamydomonas sp. UWO 241]